MKHIVLLLSAACLMMVLTAGVVSAKTLFISETTEVSNPDATVWADAFSATVKLKTYNNQCIELRFSTEALTSGLDTPHIAFQALIDGVLANPAATIMFEPSEFDFFDIANFSWYLCGLNIGRHTVQIQFSPAVAGNEAVLRSGSLIIEMKSGRLVF